MPVYEGNSSVRPESKKASTGSKGAYSDTGQGNRTLTFRWCHCKGHWAVGLWVSCTSAAVCILPRSTQYSTLSEMIQERRWLARSFTYTFHSNTHLDPYWMKNFIHTPKFLPARRQFCFLSSNTEGLCVGGGGYSASVSTGTNKDISYPCAICVALICHWDHSLWCRIDNSQYHPKSPSLPLYTFILFNSLCVWICMWNGFYLAGWFVFCYVF